MHSLTKAQHHTLATAGILLAAILCYFNSFSGVWVFDDYSYVVDNPFVRQLWVFGTGYPHPYRPVLEWTYALNFSLSGLDIAGYHAFNLLVHALAGLTLYAVIRRTLVALPANRYTDSATTIAFVTALLWIVHPLQTESVTYISQRSESLMGLLMLLSLYSVIRAHFSDHKTHRHLWYLASFIAFALGCGVKEIMTTGLPLIMIYDRVFLSDSWAQVHSRRWILYTGFFAAIAWMAATSDRLNTTPDTMIVVALIVVAANLIFHSTYHLQSETTGRWIRRALLVATGACLAGVAFLAFAQLLNSMERYTSVSMVRYAGSQIGVIAHYISLAFWPSPLILDHDWPVIESWASLGLSSVVMVVVLSASAFLVLKFPPLGFVALSFFLILSPTSSFIPLRDLAVEHRMYLPLASIVLFVVLALKSLTQGIRPATRTATRVILTLAAMLSLMWGTVERNKDYQHPEILWTQALVEYPVHKRVHLNMAQLQTQQGEYESAYRHYQNGLPFNWLKDELGAKVYYNFGVTLQALNQPDAAEMQYLLAARLEPESLVAASSFNQLGLLSAEKRDLLKARRYFDSAIDAVPTYAIAYKNLGIIYTMQGRWRRAEDQLREAVRLDPDFAEAHFALGEVLEERGKRRQAARSYESVLRINPDHIGARDRLAEIR